MNGEQPKIEIFEPFGAGFELMKRILFRPFGFGKWCVIGFAAFLSGALGMNFSFNFPSKADWNFRSFKYGEAQLPDALASCALPLIIALVVLIIIIAVVFMWIGARGRFIFTDCVVKNRAAIVVPWKEYRREGNSFFLFLLAVMFLTLMVLGTLVLLIALPLGLFSHAKMPNEFGVMTVFAIVFVGLVWLAFAIFFAVVTQFMVVVMYRRRCLAREAFVDVSKLILARPGPFVLFVLFGIVLLLALVVISTIMTCLTCCIAGLPYVSSVVLLPAFVWLLGFKLLFLRQFGPEYDVWAPAEIPAPALPTDPSSAPPSPTE